MDDISKTDNTSPSDLNHNNATQNPIEGGKVHLWGHKSPITVDHTSYNNFEQDPDLIVEIDIPLNKLADKHIKTSAKNKRISSAGAFSGSGTDRSNRSSSGRTRIKSQSRPMKPHEPEPFLTVDTVKSGRMSDTPSEKVPQRPTSFRKGRAPTVTGNLFIPNGRSSSPYISSGRNTPGSSIFVSPGTRQVQKPNVHVRTPFKHSMQKAESSKERPSSPAQDLKELTAFATFQVGKLLAKESPEPKSKAYGRLLKGKLKPLNTVNVKGPSIDRCRGIVSESRGTLPPPNKTLARRREILERIPNVHEFLYDRPRTEESIHRTSRASSVDENREIIIKEGTPDHEVYGSHPPYQTDTLPVVPSGSRMSGSGPTGPTPTPRMFVTEINNKDKENTPFDNNISNKIQNQLEMQPINVEANDQQDNQERPSTAGKLVRFAEVSNQDNETSKDLKQIQNAKIAEGLRGSTVSTEDTLDEIAMKVDITIIEKSEQEDNTTITGEITEESEKEGKKSKQTCKPEDEEITKKDDNDDDDNINDKHDNKFKENKTTNASQSQNTGRSSSRAGSKNASEKGGQGKQSSVHMCRSKDRYSAPSTLQIQSVLHDGNVYYTVGAESPRRSPSPTRSRSPSPGLSSKRNSLNLNKADVAKNKSNRLVRPSSANCKKRHTRRSSQSSQSSVSSITNKKSDSSELFTSRRSKVYFEGETPPRESIFTESKIGDDIDIALKSEKPISFDDLDEELMAIQESIKMRRGRSLTDNSSSNLDLSMTLDSEESELQRQIEEKIMNLELNSKSQQTDDDLCDDAPKDNVQRYVDLLEMYRNKCMTVSEKCGCISDSLTTPRPASPAVNRKHSYSRPSSASRKGSSASKKLTRRNSFHFEKPTVAEDENSKNNTSVLNKELFRTPSVVSMATDSGCSLGFEADDSKVPSLRLTAGDSDVCITDRTEDKEEKPLLAIVCDHLPVKEVPDNTMVDGRIVNEAAGVDFQVVAKALEFSKPKPVKKQKNKEPVAPFAPLCFRLNARPPTGYIYYFAYGPDMNPSRVSTYLKREVSCRYWGLLFGFQLVFNKKGLDIEAGGFANIEFNPFCSVEGVIYQITSEELQLLDRHVGYPEHYTHLMLPVWMSNSTSPDQYGVAQYCVPAIMYIAQDKWLNKDETLNCDYALQQCIKSSDLVTPDYRDHMVNYCQPIPEQVVCVS